MMQKLIEAYILNEIQKQHLKNIENAVECFIDDYIEYQRRCIDCGAIKQYE